MKRTIAFILSLILCLSCFTPVSMAADGPPQDPGMTEEGHLTEPLTAQRDGFTDVSEARAKYNELLEGNYKNGELKEKFEEYFGALSPEYIMDNYTELFDIEADEVDEGFLEAICYDGEKNFAGENLMDWPEPESPSVPLEDDIVGLNTDYEVVIEDIGVTMQAEEVSPMASNAIASVSLVSKTETSVTLDLSFINSGDKNNALQMYDTITKENIWVLKDVRTSRVTVNNLRLGGKYTFWAGTWYNESWFNSEPLRLRTSYPAEKLVSYSKSNMEFSLDTLITNIWGAAITEQFLTKANNGYSVIFDLVGGKAPFGGDKMQFTNTRTLPPNVEGLSGQPIQWQSIDEDDNYSGIDHAYMMKRLNAYTTETPYHEIAHNFDNPKWTFEAEALAILKIYYYFSTTNDGMAVAGEDRIWTGKDYKTYMKSYANRVLGHINYDAAMAQGVYSPYSLAYNLGDIADRIGWDAYKQTFRFFDSLPSANVPNSKIGKFNLFLSKLTDFSGQDVFSMFTSKEKGIYESYLGGKMEYMTIQVDDSVRNGVMYPGGVMTAVTTESDLNATMEILEMEIKDTWVNYSIKVYTPTDKQYSSWTINGTRSMYYNPSDLDPNGNVLIAKTGESSNWETLHFSLEGPAIDSILLPVNRGRLSGENIFKISLRYKDTGDIYYFEGTLPDQTLFDTVKNTIAYNAEIWPDTRAELHKTFVWFFDYLGGEGEVKDPGSNSTNGVMTLGAPFAEWDTLIPEDAREKLGRWMSVGLFERDGVTQMYGYYTEVYKYPKENQYEQDFYGFIATDVLTWAYAISGVADNQVFTAANESSAVNMEAKATITIMHSGQSIYDSHADIRYPLDDRLGPFFLGNVKVGIGFENGAEIVTTLTPSSSAREATSNTKIDVKNVFNFVTGFFKYGAVISKAVSILDFVKTEPPEASEFSTGMVSYGGTVEDQLNTLKGLVTYASTSSNSNGKNYYLIDPETEMSTIIEFVNPAPPSAQYPDWDRRLGEQRNMVVTFEFDVCEMGVKPDGYFGVVTVQKGVEWKTNDPPHITRTFTVQLA